MSKHKLDKMPPFLRYLTVTGFSLIFAVCCALIVSAVALGSEDPTANLALYGEIIFLVSAFICGFIGAKTATEGKFLCGLLSSALMLAIIISASLALGNAALPKSLILSAAGLATSLIGSLIGSKDKKRRRKR